MVYMAVTDHCPTRCAYCAVPDKKKKMISAADAESVIEDAVRAGMVRLQLVGGEPLTHPGFERIVDAAAGRKVFLTVSTGGTLIRDKISALKKMSLVFVSLDGEKDIHDAHRGAGVFDKVTAGIALLRENGIKHWTTTVVTRLNKDRLLWVAEFARGNGHMANFHMLYTTGEKKEGHFHPGTLPDLALTHEESAEALRFLRGLKEKGYPVASSFGYFDYLLGWPNLPVIYSAEQRGSVKCHAGELYCYIDSDLAVYPCGDAIGRTPGADITASGGFRGAFGRLGPKPCASCVVACNVEQNLIFSMRPGAVLNWARNIIKR
jgi:MoaA/NifB/PqqE/SkfB family radical SAM enzyme